MPENEIPRDDDLEIRDVEIEPLSDAGDAPWIRNTWTFATSSSSTIFAPSRVEVGSSLLNGPQINPDHPDVVANQEQVDDLLASLGF